MKKFTKLMAILLIAGMIPLLNACKAADPVDAGASETRTVVDAYGRSVEIPKKISSIICVGNGAMRLVSYLGANDLLAGIEEGDLSFEQSPKRDYAYVLYDKFKDLPVIGKGGGAAYTAYPEEVVKVNPSVIISCYTQEAAEQLAAETGIPVVCVRWQSTNFIDESVYTALNLLGDILDKTERCNEIINFIDTCKSDLKDRTKDIPDTDKPKVYTGAVTYNGAHGFSGTYANFGPFMAVGALNVADETGEQTGFDVDLEKVVIWNPDYIFLDLGNMNLVNEEYAANPGFFDSLSAVQNGEVYALPAFNNYSTNITYAIMDAYYVGKVLYPDKFADIDMAAKSDEILQFFIGRGYFDKMVESGLGFGKITIGEK